MLAGSKDDPAVGHHGREGLREADTDHSAPRTPSSVAAAQCGRRTALRVRHQFQSIGAHEVRCRMCASGKHHWTGCIEVRPSSRCYFRIRFHFSLMAPGQASLWTRAAMKMQRLNTAHEGHCVKKWTRA
mmetsp:Transcript_13243/g.30974  ORF Transcript_13243/g.30974 Transcript_13243/m.30974 type:complete len:129 (-) Transcript_13243:19-405(-)